MLRHREFPTDSNAKRLDFLNSWNGRNRRLWNHYSTTASRAVQRVSVRQIAGRAAQPLGGHLVQIARGLGLGNDFIDLQAQLVLALGDADEVGRILQHELVLGAQRRGR